MSASGTMPPPVSWAQRLDLLYVIIDVECKDIEHSVTDNSFHFKGINALDANIKYDVTLNFLHPIDTQRVTSKNIGRCLEFTIYKKEAGPYWKTLTNDKTRLHFLKANFSKWKNESDDEDEANLGSSPFENFANPSMDWNNKFDDFNDDEDEDDDSDDNIPTLTQTHNGEDEEKEENKNEEEAAKQK